MYKPILTIDLPKLRDNARVEKKELGEHGIEVMAVLKSWPSIKSLTAA